MRLVSHFMAQASIFHNATATSHYPVSVARHRTEILTGSCFGLMAMFPATLRICNSPERIQSLVLVKFTPQVQAFRVNVGREHEQERTE